MTPIDSERENEGTRATERASDQSRGPKQVYFGRFSWSTSSTNAFVRKCREYRNTTRFGQVAESIIVWKMSGIRWNLLPAINTMTLQVDLYKWSMLECAKIPSTSVMFTCCCSSAFSEPW